VAELEAKFGDRVEVELIESSRGAFEVVADGKTIHSKWESGEFPRYRQIPKIIDDLLPLPPRN
jgi:selT/selW/selH-like putative selenoprotein